MEKFEITKANPSDFISIKELMLTALQTDPTAFSSDYSDYAYNPDIWWNNYVGRYTNQLNATLFLIKENTQVKGMVGVLYDISNRKKHIASVVWFYINKDIRGKGLGKKLFTELINEIKKNKKIRKISLFVNAPQQNAIDIYKKFGFETAATLKEELFINGVYTDQYIMELFL